MSDPLAQAKQAERELNSYEAKTGGGKQADSTLESGINEQATTKFAAQGATVTYGSAASGAGDNREIPESEGGSIRNDGRPTKARDFEGEGGPEEKQERAARDRGGDEGVKVNETESQKSGDGAVKNS